VERYIECGGFIRIYAQDHSEFTGLHGIKNNRVYCKSNYVADAAEMSWVDVDNNVAKWLQLHSASRTHTGKTGLGYDISVIAALMTSI
jgi:hypothetical protein